MTTYAGKIDKTEAGQGVKFSALVGAGGVTVGQPLKWDGSTANTVIASTTTTDVICGVAQETVSTVGASVLVLSDGCLVKTPYTLTVGGKVGVGTSGTAGTLVNYSSGVLVGTVVAGATLASVVRISIQLVMA